MDVETHPNAYKVSAINRFKRDSSLIATALRAKAKNCRALCRARDSIEVLLGSNATTLNRTEPLLFMMEML